MGLALRTSESEIEAIFRTVIQLCVYQIKRQLQVLCTLQNYTTSTCTSSVSYTHLTLPTNREV